MAAHKYAEIVDQVRDLYIQGKSKKDISLTLNIEGDAVRYILYVQLKIHEAHPRRNTGAVLIKELPKDKINKIINLTNFGYSTLEIAHDQEMIARDVYKIVSEAKKNNLIKKVC